MKSIKKLAHQLSQKNINNLLAHSLKKGEGRKQVFSKIPIAMFIIVSYFILASFMSHFFLHNAIVHRLIMWLPEQTMFLVTYLFLLVGVPSSLVVDPAILTVDPILGVIKLSIIATLVAASQIFILFMTGLNERIVKKEMELIHPSVAVYAMCLLLRFLPIMPFGIATLFLFYKLKKTNRVLLITILGSLIYYFSLSFFMHHSLLFV